MAAFDRKGVDSEGIRIGPAMCMALLGSLGITETIDDACKWDRKQRVLSPGTAVKAMAGTMFTENQKQAMNNIGLFYNGAPADMLFGPKVTGESLSDSSLGRALETVFNADTEQLFCSICSKVKAQLGLDPRMFNFDPTNITISRSEGDEYGELPEGAPVPKLGFPKDNTTHRVQYNVSCAVDEFGMPSYVKTCDGNTDERSMISDAVRFVENVLGDKRMIAVGDSKMTQWDLVEHMCAHGTHFVSKPPQQFAGSAKERAVKEALSKGFVNIGKIGSRKDSPEFEVCDIDLECNNRMLRFVAYRRTDHSREIRHMKREDGKALDKLMRCFEKKLFKTEEEAVAAYTDAVKGYEDGSYDLIPTFRSKRSIKFPSGLEWKATFKKEFNEARATEITKNWAGVMITNLPRSGTSFDDLTKGATARDVMRVYFGQWKIENLFGTMKSGMGADSVFFQNPERESVMIFIIALAALVRSIVKMRLRSERSRDLGIRPNMTAERMFLLTQNVSVRCDRAGGRIYLDGTPGNRERVLRFIDALGIDPDTLLG